MYKVTIITNENTKAYFREGARYIPHFKEAVKFCKGLRQQNCDFTFEKLIRIGGLFDSMYCWSDDFTEKQEEIIARELEEEDF